VQVLIGGVRTRRRWNREEQELNRDELEVVPGLAAGKVGMSRKW
jgi:hypothetical protein